MKSKTDVEVKEVKGIKEVKAVCFIAKIEQKMLSKGYWL